MKKFEYEMETYPPQTFLKQEFICGEDGSCTPGEVLDEEHTELLKRMNERGSQGWELVQIIFEKKVAAAVWKRKISAE
ncbi:MAG: hypothetical protein GY850_11080 [bacterium]|nr:hypothetical protein [bacterium]